MRRHKGRIRLLGDGRRKLAANGRFHRFALKEFRAFVSQIDFPCLGAKAAFNAASYQLRSYQELGGNETSSKLAGDLDAFISSGVRQASNYATFIAVFAKPIAENENQFECRLWSQLTDLNRIDAARSDWDPSVASNPNDPHFSFSFGGQALYVIGMHANSSRLSRRFRLPALVFNPHDQFERLRAEGKWQRMQESIRARDLVLQGAINPMLSDFGQKSEARQYSGRSVDETWEPKFTAAGLLRRQAPSDRCPFGR
jgi:FPC/CPF motif-containing protein YcgG